MIYAISCDVIIKDLLLRDTVGPTNILSGVSGHRAAPVRVIKGEKPVKSNNGIWFKLTK